MLKNGPRVIINPAIKEKTGISPLEISTKIIQCLEISKNSKALEKSEFNKNLVLESSGVKSQTKFNNLYQYLLCEERDNKFFPIDRKTNMEYVFGKEDVIGLGNQVLKIFSRNECSYDSDSFVFKTVNENNVIYLRPSEDFEDIGDGHTDAYQIYTYEKNDKNYIAFLIDNGYSDFTETSIKQRWQQMYGILTEFHFLAVDNTYEKIVVQGGTKGEMITSHIYQDGEACWKYCMRLI